MGLAGTEFYPPARRRLRLGIVGGGRGLVGSWHMMGARLSDRWDLIAGALSADPDVARDTGRAWMLREDRIYTDYEAMAKAEARRGDGVEAVVIATPNWTHRHIAETFMDAGIDIICDKPMAMTREDGDALIERQRETGLVFAITHPYTYHPMVRQAHEMVKSGAIGEVRQALVEYAQDFSTGPDDPDFRTMAWRRDPSKVGRASATADIGTHALQVVEFVSGLSVGRLRAEFHVCGAPKAMEDTAFLNLRFENGAPGTMWVTQAAPGNYCGLRVRVFGEKGGLAWDQEFPDTLEHMPFEEPRQTIIRGHGSGVLPSAERMVLLPRGCGGGTTDAWGNLYTEIAVAVEARRNGETLPEGLLALPDVHTGARGVNFINAAADSHEAGGDWTDLA